MRCKEIRQCVDELGAVSLPDGVRRHVAACPACEAYLQDHRLVRAGLRSLAQEAPPELSVGFAARLVRGLDGIAEIGRYAEEAGEEFLEQTGRRFVYASLLLALTLLLVLLAPVSGPLRAPSTADSYLAEPEAFNSLSDLSGDPASQLPALSGPASSRGGQSE